MNYKLNNPIRFIPSNLNGNAYNEYLLELGWFPCGSKSKRNCDRDQDSKL